MSSPLPDPDQGRLWRQLMELSELREEGEPGWTRRVFSEPYRRSRELVLGWMAEAGLRTEVDPAGNLIGRLEGEGSPIVLGSHTDTVAGGGRFDGMVGVVAAIEVARLLSATRPLLRRPLWVVDFLGEEPNRFGLSCVGSRAVTGHLSEEQLGLRDGSATLGEELSLSGGDPSGAARMSWPPGLFHLYLELHIEQGPHLERSGAALGVVTAIAGISRAAIRLTGRPDHAGTVPMELRRDALAAASEAVLAVEQLAAGPSRPADGGLAVATVGRIEVDPGATNVVPGEVRLQAEIRATDPGWLAWARSELERQLGEIASRRQLDGALTWLSREPPVGCTPKVREMLLGVVREMGETELELSSGASHDAAHLAALGPMGMLFIPSRHGRSHCPEEWSEPEQVTLGARALAGAVLAADGSQFS